MSTLIQLRNKIDKIDAAIIKKLAQRNKIAQKIGKLKAQSGKKVLDNKREQQLMRYHESLCEQYQLSAVFVKRLFKMIIAYSRRLQSRH
ncbi:MAG TPA: chorismate mutase [Gammaproteobacteria bacterium]|jgi:chorismate mutase|nr:chorismate mutase [Gammaproteobacteria bacterium]